RGNRLARRKTHRPNTFALKWLATFARQYSKGELRLITAYMIDNFPTPYILVDAAIVGRNLAKMADYAAAHGLKLRPHTKTHKSTFLARMQIEHGAVGLSVAKPGEAKVMAEVGDDILMAYPAIDPQRCRELAELARTKTMRVGIDSQFAADQLAT